MGRLKSESRSRIRYTPYNNNEFGLISFHSHDAAKNIASLIINESAQGACLAINRKLIEEKLVPEVGLVVSVKIGNLDPEEAVIRWIIKIDDDILKLGIEYQQQF